MGIFFYLSYSYRTFVLFDFISTTLTFGVFWFPKDRSRLESFSFLGGVACLVVVHNVKG